MGERKNVHTVTKWVASSGRSEYSAGYYYETAGAFTAKLRKARLYDSPSDVPDDCTPVRVRVETWEEEGEPEEWDGEGKPDGFRMVRLYDDGTLGNAPDRYPTPLPPREAKDALREWHHDYPAPYFTALTAIPVRIPTETKRKVTLDPEPTETGCRCREALERLQWTTAVSDACSHCPCCGQSKENGHSWGCKLAHALADCDCKSEADDE